MDNIKQSVIEIIARTLNVDVSVLHDNTAIGDIDQWDSMGNIAILAAVEKEMNVDFPIEELFKLNTVDSIVNKTIELKHV